MEITRKDAIKIIEKITYREDPYWEDIIEDWYEENDAWPTIIDVFEALGISKEEYEESVHG
ncbi:hypothetical protein KAR91_79090 [Candidatus Pacearchaeota archaeon]|nr:hypothetical protein [Candidatus Pacearchaeota archaeon]